MSKRKRLNKQKRYVERRRQLGFCIVGGCPNLAEPMASDPQKLGPYCQVHKVANRERARGRIKAKRRWKNSSSYQTEV